jgi:hypothetical protein
MSKRQSANFEILNILYRVVLDNPDWRFSQVLRNAEVVRENRKGKLPICWLNEFNLESEALLERIKANVK